MTHPASRLLLLATALVLAGCAEGLSYLPGASGAPVDQVGAAPPGNTGVSQAGAQDFGLFREILERGEIPAPETLDAMGFFAEHKLDFPDATCGDDVCLHGLVGMMGNMITGSRCTLLMLGMTSPIDLGTLQRPPLDLALAIDVSGSMQGQPLQYVKRGLLAMLDALEEGDRITLVTYSEEARVVAENVDPVLERAELEAIFEGLTVEGATNIYDGLFTALASVHAFQEPGRQARVVLLSDGEANRGITEAARFSSLAEGYAKEGIGITSVGVGAGFDVTLMRAVSDVGAGNFYFLEDPAAVEEVFREEVVTFLVPLALDVSITVDVKGDFQLLRAYGTRGYEGGARGATIEIPALFLAGRSSAAEPIETGRRGGGGGILVEVLDEGLREDPAHVASVSLSYTDPLTGERHGHSVGVENPIADGREFPDEEGYFNHHTVEKGFVALNVFAAFDLATRLAADGDFGTARETLAALRPGVQRWLEESPDADIEDDLVYLDLFLENLPLNVPASSPAEPWPAD